MKKRIIELFATATFVIGVSAGASAGVVVVSDFNDGTLQGWTITDTDGDGFTFANPGTGGNSGGYAQLTDLKPGGGGGLAKAPSQFLGDLSGYASVSWDVLLPANPVKLVPFAIGNGTTSYQYDPTGAINVGVWNSWTAPLDGGAGWTLLQGSETFAQMLQNVTIFAFVLEISQNLGAEAGLDNVQLNPIPTGGGSVPEPAPLGFLALGILGVGWLKRKRRTIR